MSARASRASTPGPLRVLVLGAEWSKRPFVDDLLLGLADSGLAVTVVGTAVGARPPHPLSMLRGASAERRLLADPLGLAASVRAALGSPRAAGRLMARSGSVEPNFRARSRSLLRCLPSVRGRWDVIYLPWVGSLLPFQLLVGGETPLVVSCRGRQINIARHDPRQRQRFDRMVDSLRRVAVVHCVSSHMAATVRDLGIDSERIRVVRPAVDTLRFSPSPAEPAGAPDQRSPDRRRSERRSLDRLHLVTVGRLHWNKGQELALVALRHLLDRGVPAELTLIGEGPDRARLLYCIHDLGLGERARLLGAVDRESVRRRLLDADVFVLPSLTEGLSNAALEAMASGVPVVSTTAGGMREAIDHGVEGLLVDVRDPEALASACETLWLGPGTRSAMGAAARRRVERDFTRASQIEAFAALLRDAARQRPGTFR